MDIWKALHKGTPLISPAPVKGAKLVRDAFMNQKTKPGPPKKPHREKPEVPKVVGVSWVKDRNMWRAKVTVSGISQCSYHEHHDDAVLALARYKGG